jgi:hypothetical protein
MLNRILFSILIGVTLMVVTASTETANAQVVVGGRTYVQVPNRAYSYGYYARPRAGYYVRSPYARYPYYGPYVQRPYYPPYGTHYAPYPSYYYSPYVVRYGNQWNYRRR